MYFYLKEPNAKTETPIYLIYYIDKSEKSFKISTKQKINPVEWNFDNKYPKSRRGGKGKLNNKIALELDRYKKLLDDTIHNFKINNKRITKEALKAIFKKHFDPNYIYKETNLPFEISEALNFFIEKRKESEGVTKSWICRFTNLRKKIILFDDFKFKGNPTTFDSLDSEWTDSFCGFLRKFPDLANRDLAKEIEVKIPSNGLNDNTLHGQIRALNTFLNWVKANYNDDIKAQENKIKTYDPEDIHLTYEEIEKIENVKLTDPFLKTIKNIFLIGVYSGQRKSDYSIFEQADVIETKHGKMIKRKNKKTFKPTLIPLTKKLENLLNHFNWKIPKIRKLNFNNGIKKICKIAGINSQVKKITKSGNKITTSYHKKYEIVGSHTARRTFITLSSENGMPDHIIMSITGITNTNTLLRYKKTSVKSVFDFAHKIWDEKTQDTEEPQKNSIINFLDKNKDFLTDYLNNNPKFVQNYLNKTA